MESTNPEYRGEVRPAAKGLFLASQGAYGFATSIFDLVYTLHLFALHMSPADVGTIFLTGFLAMAGAVVPLGLVADRLGQSRAMWMSSSAFGASMLVFPWITSFVGQLVAFASSSILSAIMLASTTAVSSRLASNETDRHSLFRGGFAMFLLFSAIGAIAGGWIVDVAPEGTTKYAVALLVAGSAGIVLGATRLLLSPLVPRPNTTPIPHTRTSAEGAAHRIPHKLWGSFFLVLAVSAFVGGYAVLGIRYVTVILTDHYHMSPVAAGYLVGIDRLVSIAVLLLLGPLIRKAPTTVVGAGLMFTILPLQIAGGLATTAILFSVPYLMTRGLYYAQAPILDIVTNRYAPPNRSTLINAASRLGYFGGGGLAALLYGALLGEDAFVWAMTLGGSLAAGAAVVYLWASLASTVCQ